MNISGIRTAAGFYDYNTIKLNEARNQQILEAKSEDREKISQEEPEVIEKRLSIEESVKGAEEYASQYQPDAVYEPKGAESDLASLDVEKAISDMKKDQVLQQYQFFIGESIAFGSNELGLLKQNENFDL